MTKLTLLQQKRLKLIAIGNDTEGFLAQCLLQLNKETK